MNQISKERVKNNDVKSQADKEILTDLCIANSIPEKKREKRKMYINKQDTKV